MEATELGVLSSHNVLNTGTYYNVSYSDRFIPSRVSTDLESALTDTSSSIPSYSSSSSSSTDANNARNRDTHSLTGQRRSNVGNSAAFNNLLRNELLSEVEAPSIGYTASNAASMHSNKPMNDDSAYTNNETNSSSNSSSNAYANRLLSSPSPSSSSLMNMSRASASCY